MGELAMRPVDLAPLIEQGQDLLRLDAEQPMARRTTRCVVDESAAGPPDQPSVRAPLGQLEPGAGSPQRPARRERLVGQIEQACLGGRVDSGRDTATQPQPSFPSISISLTAISFNASPRRAFSALASSSS